MVENATDVDNLSYEELIEEVKHGNLFLQYDSVYSPMSQRQQDYYIYLKDPGVRDGTNWVPEFPMFVDPIWVERLVRELKIDELLDI